MRIRSKILVSLGIAAVAMGTVAGGAFADGGHGKDMGKNLRIDIKHGVVTGVDATSVSIDPDGAAGPLDAWTCAFPVGETPPTVAVGDMVKRARCADDGNGALVLRKLRIDGQNNGDNGNKASHDQGGTHTGRITVEARGMVTAFTQDAVTGEGAITVNPGTGLPPVTCVLKSTTRVLGTPAVNDVVKIKCRNNDSGQLVAKKVKERGLIQPGEVQVEIKGTVSAAGGGVLTVAGITCTTTPAQDAAFAGAGIVSGAFVEAHCSGTPFALDNVHLEN